MLISIREAQEGDYESILNSCSEEGWVTFTQRREDYIAALNCSTLLVACEGDSFLGFARAISDGYVTTFLCELLVVEEHRRKGVGRMLVERVREIFPKTRMDLISDADEFYTKLQFKSLGTGFRKSEDV